MKPEPGSDPMSIGDETLAFTMQVEVASATLDPAAFDMPDEPGMVRIPVTLSVLVPEHLLHPPPSPGEPGASSPSGPGDPPCARFGRYPRAIAALNLARSFRDTRRTPRDG